MQIVVIGAGVTGLCAARSLLLAESIPDTSVIVVEKSCPPAGLMQTTRRGDYWWDDGAYLFWSYSALVSIVPEIFEVVENYAEKKYVDGAFREFPIDRQDIIPLLSPKRFAHALMSYGYHLLRRCLKPTAPHLHAWCQDRLTPMGFEESHLETFFVKLMGRGSKELSPLFGEARFSFIDEMTKPKQVARLIFKQIKRQSEGAGNLHPCYPRGVGAGAINSAIVNQVRELGGQVRYNMPVKQIHDREDRGVEIHCRHNNADTDEIIQADYVISTIPIDILAHIKRPSVSPTCLKISESLEYRSLLLIFFIVDRSVIISDIATVYTCEKHHVWHRLVSQSLGGGRSSIVVEATFSPTDDIDTQSILKDVEKNIVDELKLFKSDEIVARDHKYVEYAYPVLSLGYEHKVSRIIKEVESRRVRTAGKQGKFRYWGTSNCVKDASDVVDDIIADIVHARHNQNFP